MRLARIRVKLLKLKHLGHCFVVAFLVSSLASLAHSDVVKVAVPEYFPPYYELNEGGEPQGFAVDLMDAVAERAGLELAYRSYPSWKEVHEAVRRGDAQVIPNMGITESRAKIFAFSSPVETFTVSVFTREDSYQLESLQDLRNERIGVVENNVAVRMLAGQSYTTRLYDDWSHLFLDLMSGRIDALAYPDPVVWQTANSLGFEDRIKSIGPALVEIKRGIAVLSTPENMDLLAQLELGLTDYLRSDEYTSDYKFWFPDPEPYWTAQRVLSFTGGGTVALLFLMFLWRAHSLKKMVGRLEVESGLRSKAEQALIETNQQLETRVNERTQALWKSYDILSCIDEMREQHISEPDPFVMYPNLLERLLKLTGCEFGLISDVLFDEQGDPYLKIFALSNLAWDEESKRLYERQKHRGFEFRNLNNLLGEAVTTREVVVSNAPKEDPRAGGFPQGHPDLECFAGLPIFSGKRLVGQLGFANRKGGFTPQFIEELEPIVAALGQIIVSRWETEARQAAERELKRLATTDSLTGIANRRALYKAMEEERARTDRYQVPLSLLIMDIDFFKQVNDDHGHEAGDEIIVKLVKLTQSQIREVDLLARWGGEEFICLLPQADSEESMEIAERIRDRVERDCITEECSVTVSIGVATLYNDEENKVLISRADTALYAAKNQGRNRVCFASTQASAAV